MAIAGADRWGNFPGVISQGVAPQLVALIAAQFAEQKSLRDQEPNQYTVLALITPRSFGAFPLPGNVRFFAPTCELHMNLAQLSAIGCCEHLATQTWPLERRDSVWQGDRLRGAELAV